MQRYRWMIQNSSTITADRESTAIHTARYTSGACTGTHTRHQRQVVSPDLWHRTLHCENSYCNSHYMHFFDLPDCSVSGLQLA